MNVKLFRHVDKPGTPKAYLFQRIDKKEVAVWIPKSLITHISQLTKKDKSGFTTVLVDVADWFATQNGL